MQARCIAVPALAAFLLAGCTLRSDPTPIYSQEAFGGTGDLMTRCAAYRSESTCEQQIWGGDE